ncbi:hypothetical protein NQ038_05105 [Brevibacterium sp. 50QC2O2]|jgi:hypothetical protein|uniref:hypothetical protein n=1 Tax=Brevibacterium TaxID=1696 RepID=UPI00211C491E|nr:MULTISPECIES: hypothetical protein [unclassified Brevibacterium]MCQ9367767.1 hypothetical protein [Brevibacterium sp. 91QC2O2]MCQ9384927.1 hypothetical protein [Brevibacterium sp. 68QC2CO]MCQ9388026.1 hypothetical protein [Brevibacterium sp. 50QC2O2]
MSIDWMSLAVVCGITVGATAVIAIIVATSAKLLDRSHVHEVNSGPSAQASAERIGGMVLLAVVGLMLLFGLWLIVPYFH